MWWMKKLFYGEFGKGWELLTIFVKLKIFKFKWILMSKRNGS